MQIYKALLDIVQNFAHYRPVWNIASSTDHAIVFESANSLFPDEPFVLTHGDLAANSNVIVKTARLPDVSESKDDAAASNKSCLSFCILDWELAGFYPLGIARWLSGTVDEQNDMQTTIASLCEAQKALSFGEEDRFSTAYKSLLVGLAQLKSRAKE